jgi:hypothetical protein
MIKHLEALMFRKIATALALTFALSSATLAQGVSGAWDLVINGPEGAINATATLKQDGEKVTGSIDTPQGKADLTGTLKGKAINVGFTIAGPQGNLEIKVTGEVDGPNMKGMIDFQMGQAEFTAKKK